MIKWRPKGWRENNWPGLAVRNRPELQQPRIPPEKSPENPGQAAAIQPVLAGLRAFSDIQSASRNRAEAGLGVGGQIACFRKLNATPPPPSPSIGIDGEGERGGGFNRVLNRFEGRRLRVTLPKTETRPSGRDRLFYPFARVMVKLTCCHDTCGNRL